MKMFVHLFSPNGFIIPIVPLNINYIDYAADKKGNMIVGDSLIVMSGGNGVNIKGAPRDVAKEIERQMDGGAVPVADRVKFVNDKETGQ